MTTANKVFSGPATNNRPHVEERKVASGQTITPGMLMETDGSDEWIVHGTAGDGGNVFIANQNEWFQQSVSDDLTVGENAEGFSPVAGEYYNLILLDGETISKGDALSSNGDGKVVAATTGTATPDIIIGYADEALSPSGSDGRIRTRIAAFGSKATA